MDRAEEGRVGLVVFAHGSSVPEANEAVRQVAAETSRRCGLDLWSHAFLPPVRPDLGDAVDALRKRGVRKIVVTPYFLTMGMHLQKDLPRIIDDVSHACPGVEIVCSPPLDGDPFLADILAKRVRQALSV